MTKRGFTIIELVVVMFVVGILGAVVAQFVIYSGKQQAELDSRSIVQAEVALALDRVTKIVRSTEEIVVAEDNRLVVMGYPNVSDPVPSKISMFLDGYSIKLEVIAPTGTAPNYTYDQVNAVSYSLVKNTFNSSSRPSFKYYSETSALLTSPYSLGDIKMVEIDLVGKAQGLAYMTPREVELSSKVNLRNFKTNL